VQGHRKELVVLANFVLGGCVGQQEDLVGVLPDLTDQPLDLSLGLEDLFLFGPGLVIGMVEDFGQQTGGIRGLGSRLFRTGHSIIGKKEGTGRRKTNGIQINYARHSFFATPDD